MLYCILERLGGLIAPRGLDILVMFLLTFVPSTLIYGAEYNGHAYTIHLRA